MIFSSVIIEKSETPLDDAAKQSANTKAARLSLRQDKLRAVQLQLIETLYRSRKSKTIPNGFIVIRKLLKCRIRASIDHNRVLIDLMVHTYTIKTQVHTYETYFGLIRLFFRELCFSRVYGSFGLYLYLLVSTWGDGGDVIIKSFVYEFCPHLGNWNVSNRDM